MKLNKSIQFKLFILLAGLAFFFLSGIWLYQIKEASQLNFLLNEYNQTSRQVFQRVLYLKSESVEKHVFFEYSIWNEMVQNITLKNQRWLQQQTQFGFNNYNYDFVWILDAEGNLIYATSKRKDLSFTKPPVPLEKFVPYLKDKRTLHYYSPTFLGTMEVFAASVHPSDDALRHSNPQGYFIVGRLWDNKFIREISLLSRTEIELIPFSIDTTPTLLPAKYPFGTVWFTKELSDWKGQPITTIKVISEPPWLEPYQRSDKLMLWGYTLFILFLLGVFGFYFHRWVTQPLESLSQALFKKSSNPVKYLSQETHEFGVIAGMLDQFFVQEKLVVENQRFLDTLVQNLPGMVYRCKNTPNWPMDYISEGVKALTGYKPDKFTGTDHYPFARLIHHEDRKRVWLEIQTALDQRVPFEVEYRLRDSNGNIKNLWERGRGIWDESDHLICLEGFITDITQKVQAEAALKEKIQRLELLRKVSDLFQETLEFQDLISKIYSLIPEYTGVNRVRVFLYDKEKKGLIKAIPNNTSPNDSIDPPSVDNSINPPGFSLSGTCFQNNEPIVIDDCYKTDIIPIHFVDSMKLKSVMAVPVSSRGKTIGVLRMDYTHKFHSFTSEEVEFNRLLGEQLGILIENAQLFKELVESRNAIQEKEARYREAIRSITAVPYECRYYPVRYIFMGEGIKDLLGYTPEELTVEVWTQSIKEKIPKGLMKDMSPEEATRRTLSGEMDRWEMDYRMVDRSGRERWVSDISIQLKDSSNKPYGSLGILQDVTEWKLVEQEQRRLTRALEQSTSSIIITDKKGNIEYVNNKFTEISGYTLDEIIGNKPGVLGSGSTPQSTYDWIWDTINSGNEWRGELCDHRKTGELFWVDATISPIRDKDGNITHFMNSLEDITSRKAAEKVRNVLSDLGTRLSDANSSVDVAQIILDKCDELFGWEAAFISLYSEDEKLLKDIIAYDEIEGSRQQAKTRDLAKFPPIVERTFQEGPLLILRNKTDVDRELLSLPRFGDKIRISMSLMMVPFRKQEHNIGVLSIQSYRPNAYTQNDLDLLRVIASYCSAALERTFTRQRLVERETELERKLDFISSLRAIDMAITGSMDLRININIILQQVLLRLEAEGAAVLLYNTSINQLELLQAKGVEREIPSWSSENYSHDPAFHILRERILLQVKRAAAYPYGFPQMPKSVEDKFQTYIGLPLIAKGQVQGILEVFFTYSNFEPSGEWTEFLEAMATQSAIAIDNATLFNSLQRSNTELAMAYDSTLEGWSRALDLRDKETEGHTQRVTNITVELALAMGMTRDEMGYLRWGALLHDIGKMGIPDSILLKPGPLTPAEWVVMKKHPLYAYELLSPIQYLRPALDIPYCHHEKWDGTGYPRGLKEREIPMAARIFAVVDVWDAMTSDRPYRSALPKGEVVNHIISLRGIHFDPEVTDTFLKMIQETAR